MKKASDIIIGLSVFFLILGVALIAVGFITGSSVDDIVAHGGAAEYYEIFRERFDSMVSAIFNTNLN